MKKRKKNHLLHTLQISSVRPWEEACWRQTAVCFGISSFQSAESESARRLNYITKLQQTHSLKSHLTQATGNNCEHSLMWRFKFINVWWGCRSLAHTHTHTHTRHPQVRWVAHYLGAGQHAGQSQQDAVAGYPLIRRLAVGHASPCLKLLGKKFPKNKPCYHSVNKYRVWQCSHRQRCRGSLCQQANVTNAVKGLEKVRQNHLTLIWKWVWRQTGLESQTRGRCFRALLCTAEMQQKGCLSSKFALNPNISGQGFSHKNLWNNCLHNW